MHRTTTRKPSRPRACRPGSNSDSQAAVRPAFGQELNVDSSLIFGELQGSTLLPTLLPLATLIPPEYFPGWHRAPTWWCTNIIGRWQGPPKAPCSDATLSTIVGRSENEARAKTRIVVSDLWFSPTDSCLQIVAPRHLAVYPHMTTRE